MTTPDTRRDDEPMDGDDDLRAGHLGEINGGAPQADDERDPGDVDDADDDDPVRGQ